MQETAHVDSVFEWTGHQIGAAFHDVLWTGLFVAVPASIILASFIWSGWRAWKEHDYQQLPLYLGYALVMVWLIWPTHHTYAVVVEPARGQPGISVDRPVQIRAPRILAWVGGIVDAVLGEVISKIQFELPAHVKDYSRLASLIQASSIQDPEILSSLRQFKNDCYLQALAMRAQDPAASSARILDATDVLSDPGLVDLYGRIQVSEDVSCKVWRDQIAGSITARELAANPYHREVLLHLGEQSSDEEGEKLKDMYVALIVRNSLTEGSVHEEMLWARTHFRPLDDEARFSDYATIAATAGTPFLATGANSFGLFGMDIGQSVTTLLKGVGRMLTDVFAAMGRYIFGYAITAHVVAMAPAFYGIVILITISVFPLIALWTLVPYKAMILAKYFKILISVKLWPFFWTVLAAFYNAGAIEDVLAGTESGSNALFVAAAMYLMVPAISFGVVQLSASFASGALGTLSQVSSNAGFAAVSSLALMGHRLLGAAGSLGRLGGQLIQRGGRAPAARIAPRAAGQGIRPSSPRSGGGGS